MISQTIVLVSQGCGSCTSASCSCTANCTCDQPTNSNNGCGSCTCTNCACKPGECKC